MLLSARLSTPALAHLLFETSAKAIIFSRRTERSANEALTRFSRSEDVPALIHVASYRALIDSLSSKKDVVAPSLALESAPFEDLPGSIILHSSGTTGLPKPIPLTHRYLLGYAACHQLEPQEAEGRLNVSTLPLYHV